MEYRDENSLPSRRSTKGTRRPSYTRRIKPPYSYTELIRHAILASPDRALTLRQIVVCLQNRFACFCGPYQGWRNSIRHNLSANNCFVKILRDFNKPNGKDNFWTVNENCSCSQCTKGLKQSTVSTIGLPGPYFVDISNFRPVNDMSQFGQVPEFPSIVQSPNGSESSAENSTPSETVVDPVQDIPKETPTDTTTKTADVNNNGVTDACQKRVVGTSLDVIGDKKDETLELSSVVELKRPEEYAVEDNCEDKDALFSAVDSHESNPDKAKWHEMTFTKLEELNFVLPETQSTHCEEEQGVKWSKISQQPTQFMPTPYFRPGQYSYPYPPFYPQNYPVDDRMYQSVPQQEYHAMPPPYWMGNYGEQYFQPTQSISNEQWHQYQRSLTENKGQCWTQL